MGDHAMKYLVFCLALFCFAGCSVADDGCGCSDKCACSAKCGCKCCGNKCEVNGGVCPCK